MRRIILRAVKVVASYDEILQEPSTFFGSSITRLTSDLFFKWRLKKIEEKCFFFVNLVILKTHLTLLKFREEARLEIVDLP